MDKSWSTLCLICQYALCMPMCSPHRCSLYTILIESNQIKTYTVAMALTECIDSQSSHQEIRALGSTGRCSPAHRSHTIVRYPAVRLRQNSVAGRCKCVGRGFFGEMDSASRNRSNHRNRCMSVSKKNILNFWGNKWASNQL